MLASACTLPGLGLVAFVMRRPSALNAFGRNMLEQVSLMFPSRHTQHAHLKGRVWNLLMSMILPLLADGKKCPKSNIQSSCTSSDPEK